ncbi:MAG: ATPase, T2SS/T4P/T4SS family [Acutalibacteraceae bacterium]
MENIKAKNYYKIIGMFPENLITKFLFLPEDEAEKVSEIRIRSERMAVITTDEGNYYLDRRGVLSKNKSKGIKISKEDVESLFTSLCNYSVYNRQEEIKNGFITLEGGHRVGISGTAVISEGEIVNIDNISSVIIRVAREHKECSRQILESLDFNIDGTLIAGEPSSGKTTLIRDISRIMSTENEKNIVLVDTKNEISATKLSVPQNDIGNSDAFISYRKDVAIIQAVRNLSPDIIICDEISTKEEAEAIKNGTNSGVSFVSTIHAGDKDELKNKYIFRLLKKTGAFKKVVFLKGKEKRGEVEKIIDIGEVN